MELSFSKLEDYPIAAEEILLDKIDDDRLVAVGGFQTGIPSGFVTSTPFYRDKFTRDKYFNDAKKKKYSRGFKKNAFLYTISKNSWTKLPDFPGPARQALRSVMIDGVCYMWGGFSYIPSRQVIDLPINKWPNKECFFAHKDGYKLEEIELNNTGKKVWKWSRLPNLPKPLSNFVMIAHGRKIYMCCGGSHHPDPKKNLGKLEVKINGNEILGKDLIFLDIDKLQLGWQKVSEFPGSPRLNASGLILGDEIFILGGIYANEEWTYQLRMKKKRYYNVLDNWKFNVKDGKWNRLSDTPIHNGNFGSQMNNIFNNRYVFLLGGAHFNISMVNHQLIPAIIEDKLQKAIKKRELVKTEVKMNTILIYDLIENKFSQAKDPLFNWTNLPSYVIINNIIYCLAGEQIPICFEKGCYGLQSDLFLKATIKL